jgi:hypothetical protein
MTIRLAALAVVTAAHLAYADAPKAIPVPAGEPPDPAVEQAGDANLESTADRRGFTFSVGLGGGLMIGFGIQGSVGRGGALSVRLGHVATPHTVITFEVATSAVLHEPPVMNASVETNTDTNLLAGAQYYVTPSLWIRGAGGVGIYRANQVELSGGALGDIRLIGPAVLGGIGVEFVRVRSAVMGLEVGTSAMISSSGVLMTSTLGLGFSFN